MIFGFGFLFWRDLLPTGGIWTCFPCRRQSRKSGLLRLFWKLKLIKMFILAPVAKTRQGRKSSIHFYADVIIPTKLLACDPFSICPRATPPVQTPAQDTEYLVKQYLMPSLRHQGSPPTPKDNKALFDLSLPTDSPLSEVQSAFLTADVETRDTEGQTYRVILSKGLEYPGFWYLGVCGGSSNKCPTDTEERLYFPSFLLNDIYKVTQKRKREREREELKVK